MPQPFFAAAKVHRIYAEVKKIIKPPFAVFVLHKQVYFHQEQSNSK
jgi:hypothetical protein